MLEDMDKEIDAVVAATPDHQDSWGRLNGAKMCTVRNPSLIPHIFYTIPFFLLGFY
jgi:hypothetical protein